ncbi:MAG: hypothetical protein AB7W16_09355 [Candidatus Obscuribacterales bacterium]
MRRIALPIITSCVLAGLIAPLAQADLSNSFPDHPEIWLFPNYATESPPSAVNILPDNSPIDPESKPYPPGWK